MNNNDVVMKKRKYRRTTSSSSEGTSSSCRSSRRFKNNEGGGEGEGGGGGSGGVSTTLRLYEDPWKIKKTLTESDLGILSRLLLAADLVKRHMLPMLGPAQARSAEAEEGAALRVWDMDTASMHHLLLKRWSSSKSYVLIGKWNQDFVRRRDLKKGDQIGFYWDPFASVFNFCVLKRAT